MASTFTVRCACGCGEVVTATDEGFAATSVAVEACATLRAGGAVSQTVRKSAAYAAAVAEPVIRHREGLVAFA